MPLIPGEDGPARLERESIDGEGVRSCMGSVTVLDGGGDPGCESICVCVWVSCSWGSLLEVKEPGEPCFLENIPKSIEDIFGRCLSESKEKE